MSGDDNNESAFNNDDEFSEFDDLLSRVVFDGDDLSSPDVFRDLVVSNDDDECSSFSCTSEGKPCRHMLSVCMCVCAYVLYCMCVLVCMLLLLLLLLLLLVLLLLSLL